MLGEAEVHNRSPKPSTSAGARPPPRHGGRRGPWGLQATEHHRSHRAKSDANRKPIRSPSANIDVQIDPSYMHLHQTLNQGAVIFHIHALKPYSSNSWQGSVFGSHRSHLSKREGDRHVVE